MVLVSLGRIVILLSVALAQVNIQLLANWENPPFELRLIETIASQNESYYLELVSKVAGFAIDEEGEEPSVISTDEELYESIFDLLTPTERALYDIPLANKYHSPGIIAHYNYYNEEVLPVFQSKLKKKCGLIPKTWLQYNDVIYCNPDDVYALMTDSSCIQDDIILPFDRIIGKGGPVLVLYGDVKDPVFKQFISTLYESSKDGKFRFVWRYVPQFTEERELMANYGVDMTLKRTDYIVIDDRDFSHGVKQDFLKNEEAINDTSLEFLNKYTKDIEGVSKASIHDFGIRLASLAVSTDNNTQNFNNLLRIIQDLPKFTKEVSEHPINEYLLEEIQFNRQSGLLPSGSALLLNGSPLDDLDTNVFGLYKKVKEELAYVNQFKQLGIDYNVTKDLLLKYALLSLYKNRQRDARYRIEYENSPIIYFNDVENDVAYKDLPNQLEVYFQRVQMGQIPPMKQNLHTVVFAIRLSNPEELKLLKHTISAVVHNKIPQRIGVIPLIECYEDRLLANNLFYLVQTEGVKKGYKYIRKIGEGKPKKLTDHDYVSEFIDPFVDQFDVKTPTVIINGVFYPLNEDWPYSLTRQVSEDVQYITGLIRNGKVRFPEDLVDILYADAKNIRNTLINPDDITQYKYRVITPAFLDQISHSSNDIFDFKIGQATEDSAFATLTIGGSLGSEFTLRQLLEILKFASKTKIHLKIRVINQSDEATFIGVIRQSLNKSINDAIETIENLLKEHQFIPFVQNPAIKELLASIDIHSKDFILFNGRFIELYDTLIPARILDSLTVEELDNRISSANVVSKLGKIIPNIKDYHDWFEAFSTLISKSYYIGETYLSPASYVRLDLSAAKKEHAIRFGDRETSAIHITVSVDPTQESAQKVLFLLKSIQNLDFVSMEILLQPDSQLEELPIKRFYRGNYLPKVEFDSEGSLFESKFISFENVPEKTLFTLDMDVPSSWIVIPKESVSDLDNVLLSQSGPVAGTYELENIIIEGNAFIDKLGEAPTGLQVQIPGSETNVMTNYGYLQLKANPGIWDFSIKDGRSSEIFSLLSADSASNKDPTVHDVVTLSILNLDGVHVYPRVGYKPGKEGQSLILRNESKAGEDRPEDKKSGFFSKWLPTKKPRHADINIFTIASGHLYERLMSIMTVSVMRNTDKTVKFWLIDNYMSPTFRKFLPHLAQKYGFEYELITYKWPSWLRAQREKQRTIWGYKILFLDVLFPQDLEKVIFVDADQIVRTDMKELVDLDLEGAPYGYTPMGDSRQEMEGFRFWKQGYWRNYLADQFKYHISALYVIDLKRFRQIAAGDRLRQHYNALSRDPKSLSNLDQDLPNNLQHQLKIFSLPQDWLWCETWCDDESLKTAKTIDLCNNPLTKEPKLDRARRQIPEWSVYDNEISELHNEVFGVQDTPENVRDFKEKENSGELYQDAPDSDYDHDEL